VLVLRYFFDLTEAQIASELDISKGSVKQHASRGLAALGGRVGACLVTRPEHGPENSTAALLRAALLDDLEAVMSATDTERELSRFQSGWPGATAARGSWPPRRGLVGVAAVGAFVAVRAADDDPSRVAGAAATRSPAS
jgi:hypothetical protein